MATKVSLPSHLPGKLAICYWGWDWLTSVQPGEAFDDLERVMRETKERGFNCIRADMGLGLNHDLAGQPRGEVRFLAHFAGANSNLQCINSRGGAQYDVRRRVHRLFELAEEYDMYVIGTTWLYQDMVSDIDREDIRRDVIAVPYNDRIAFLMRSWDFLLHEIRQQGLLHRFAFVELVNEMDLTVPVWPREDKQTPTYEEWFNDQEMTLPGDRLREIASDSLARLKQKYPDVLITTDMANAFGFAKCFPENAEVADHHFYHDTVTLAIFGAAGIHAGAEGFTWETGPAIEKNELLRSLLKKNVMSWQDFSRCDSHTRKMWRIIAWFYENLDNEKYDDWCRAHFDEHRRKVEDNVKKAFQTAAEFAAPRGLPLVVDEGYLFFPPLNSRFIMGPEGQWGESLAASAAIDTGYWGILPTGYFRPDTPMTWYDDAQCDWLRSLNRKILAS